MNFKVKQRGGLFERPITANVWTFMPSLKVYLRHFGVRERG